MVLELGGEPIGHPSFPLGHTSTNWSKSASPSPTENHMCRGPNLVMRLPHSNWITLASQRLENSKIGRWSKMPCRQRGAAARLGLVSGGEPDGQFISTASLELPSWKEASSSVPPRECQTIAGLLTETTLTSTTTH